MSPGFIHHIEWCVANAHALIRTLVKQYGFHSVATRLLLDPPFRIRQNVLRSGLTTFIITEKTPADDEGGDDDDDADQPSGDTFPALTCCTDHHRIDSVFNICLEVADVDLIVDRVGRTDPDLVLVGARDIVSEWASIRYAVIKSPCGNVVHTLLNTQNYRQCEAAPFLPGFRSVQPEWTLGSDHQSELRTTHMDHVTYVCNPNQSHSILKWYKTCFGMQPFPIARLPAQDQQEHADPDELRLQSATVSIHEDVDMRMTVGEWISSWLCREDGVQFAESETDPVLNFKLVLAEPLKEHSHSHVQQFLDNHGGPGLQHIGLIAPNVAHTVKWMCDNGAQFRKPPPTYYQLDEKRHEILQAHEDIDLFSSLGLLVDSEADIPPHHSSGQLDDGDRFLIQIFTQPLFQQQKDTFFLEILERRGARGFGSGNITALAKSIIIQQQQEQMRRDATGC